MDDPQNIKTLVWVGSSRSDLKAFPAEVKDVIGYALYQAQLGSKAPSAKPLAGFGGAGILEIVEDYQTNTYRAVYTLKFSDLIYMLSRRNRRKAKQHQNQILTLSNDGSRWRWNITRCVRQREDVRDESKGQINEGSKI